MLQTQGGEDRENPSRLQDTESQSLTDSANENLLPQLNHSYIFFCYSSPNSYKSFANVFQDWLVMELEGKFVPSGKGTNLYLEDVG